MTAIGLVLTILSEHPVPVAVLLIGLTAWAFDRWCASVYEPPQPTDEQIALTVAQQDLRDRRIYDAVRKGRA